ncbi:unnamed protein product [Linum trigynum]|uniref:Uncharacterized protein n=1 Tax=Linum trigynum TaxID=586398 RepID=A0AAV2GAD5_9ROSI
MSAEAASQTLSPRPHVTVRSDYLFHYGTCVLKQAGGQVDRESGWGTSVGDGHLVPRLVGLISEPSWSSRASPRRTHYGASINLSTHTSTMTAACVSK